MCDYKSPPRCDSDPECFWDYAVTEQCRSTSPIRENPLDHLDLIEDNIRYWEDSGIESNEKRIATVIREVATALPDDPIDLTARRIIKKLRKSPTNHFIGLLLQYIAEQGKFNLIFSLFKRERWFRFIKKYLIRGLIHGGHLDILEYMGRTIKEVDIPIEDVVNSPDFDKITTYLKHHLTPYDIDRAITIAIQNGRHDIVDYYLSLSENPTKPLIKGIQSDNVVDVLKLLDAYGGVESLTPDQAKMILVQSVKDWSLFTMLLGIVQHDLSAEQLVDIVVRGFSAEDYPQVRDFLSEQPLSPDAINSLLIHTLDRDPSLFYDLLEHFSIDLFSLDRKTLRKLYEFSITKDIPELTDYLYKYGIVVTPHSPRRYSVEPLKWYTHDGSHIIREYLTKGREMKPYQMRWLYSFHDTFHSVPPLTEPLTVYRGITPDEINLHARTIDYDVDDIISVSSNFWAAMYFIGEGDGAICCLLEITLLPGTKVVDIRPYNPREAELLISTAFGSFTITDVVTIKIEGWGNVTLVKVDYVPR